jgi:uncharacterized LabA/DUF88 family protein
MVAGFSHLWGAELLKVAILIDGSFFSKKFYHRNKKHPNPNDVKKLIDTALADPTLKDSILFRAYYYDCYPYNESAKHPITKQKFDYSDTNVFKARQNYLRKIALMPNIALRSGRLSFSGWKIPPRHFNKLFRGCCLSSDMVEVNLDQKQVDMKIGLDIAWISSKRIVDKLVLFTGDSDFVPAMKFARREGVMVYLVGARGFEPPTP